MLVFIDTIPGNEGDETAAESSDGTRLSLHGDCLGDGCDVCYVRRWERIPVTIAGKGPKTTRISFDVRPLTTDQWLERRFDEIGRDVGSGSVERSIGERFMPSQQRGDVRERDRWGKSPGCPERIY